MNTDVCAGSGFASTFSVGTLPKGRRGAAARQVVVKIGSV